MAISRVLRAPAAMKDGEGWAPIVGTTARMGWRGATETGFCFVGGEAPLKTCNVGEDRNNLSSQSIEEHAFSRAFLHLCMNKISLKAITLF